MRRLKAAGITAEYNPFHNGHKYHLEETMRLTGADVSVAVISGDFTQRGEPAICDKWTRAEAAVRGGVNLIVEMPLFFSIGSAGYFAESGVTILENLGCDFISFGSESGDAECLKKVSAALSDERIDSMIRASVKKGLTYPRAREEALKAAFGDEYAEILEQPNNVLALEYMRSIKKAIPVTVKRRGAGYNDRLPAGDTASASCIRDMLSGGEDVSGLVPAEAYEVLKGSRSLTCGDLFDVLRQKILTTPEDVLNKAFGAEEGLGSKVKNGIRSYHSYEDIITDLKSKRYTRTRVSRTLLNMLFGITKEDIETAPNYINILAFDPKGSEYIKQVKASGECGLAFVNGINRTANEFPELERALLKSAEASDIYNMAAGLDLYGHSDYVKKPVYVR